MQGALSIPARARLFFLILPGFLPEDPTSVNLHPLFFKIEVRLIYNVELISHVQQ